MKQQNCKILENKKIAQDIYKMRIEAPYFANSARPGQFFEVKCSEGVLPLLRRPLGLHRNTKDGVELLYEVIGRGTELLSGKRPGEAVDIIGPLGSGFKIRGMKEYVREAILVAGGIGAAPLVALAENLSHKGIKIHVLIGAKTKKHILCKSDFKRLGAKVYLATEDGSEGRRGLATDLLKDLLLITYNLKLTTIYSCGPNTMLKAVAEIARAKNIHCQVSLEERMACGVGVCLGCPVKVKNKGIEYKMVCKDGPVFNAEEVIW